MRLILALLCSLAIAAEATLTRNAVTVTVRAEADAGGPVLVATFTPERQDPPLHLYSLDLPPDAPGMATRLELAPGAPVAARGPLTADQPVHDLGGLPVYPDGAAVTLRLPITAPPATGPVPVLVTYMACTAQSCLVPVRRARLEVVVPGGGAAVAPIVPIPGLTADEVRQVVREELDRHRETAIRWRRPAIPDEAEALIREAHAAGKPALLDFTGPSCVNCQLMAKTVFRLPEVVRAWNAAVPIEIDTDPPHQALADWQQQRFGTQARPLYVRLAPDGAESRWDRVFDPADRDIRDRFIAFLDGGAGDSSGTGQGFGQFVLLAVLGGLFTLLMPCTYPMIPFTINVFTKQAAGGQRLLPLAAFYALGIIGCFVGLGVLITGVFGTSLSTLAGHPVTNLLIGALFAVLGLSLLGVFFLRLPSSWQGGSRTGYVGALVMGLTFAITAFTCTAPFAGAVLASAVATGSWGNAVLGMAIYSGTIAVPFFLLALSPGLLARMPRAGAWMNEFKVVGGIVEIAAAFKFLAICDYAWGWGVIGRDLTLAVWAASALAIVLYVAGAWRHEGDERIEHLGAGRLLVALTFLAAAVWLASGLAGNELGVVESFFPGETISLR